MERIALASVSCRSKANTGPPNLLTSGDHPAFVDTDSRESVFFCPIIVRCGPFRRPQQLSQSVKNRRMQNRHVCCSRWGAVPSMTDKSSYRQPLMKRIRLRKAVPLLVGCAAMLNPVTYMANPRSNSTSSPLISSLTPFRMPPSGRTFPRLITGDPVIRGATNSDMDPSAKPGDDFYRYANGGWVARTVLPADRQGYDTRAMLTASTRERVHRLIQDAVTTHSAKDSVAQKVGDYYASFMDESSIGSKGLAPLAAEMAAIAAIANKTALSAYLGSTLNHEVDALTSK